MYFYIVTQGDESTSQTYDLILSSASDYEVADMDGNGSKDLVVFDVGDLVVLILYRDKQGQFEGVQSIVARCGSMIVEDVDKDGQPDLVLWGVRDDRKPSRLEAWLLERKPVKKAGRKKQD